MKWKCHQKLFIDLSVMRLTLLLWVTLSLFEISIWSERINDTYNTNKYEELQKNLERTKQNKVKRINEWTGVVRLKKLKYRLQV